MNHVIHVRGAAEELMLMEAELRSDPAARRVRMERLQRPPEDYEMGPSIEALRWIGEGSGALAGVISAIVMWVTARRTKIHIVIDGREVEVDSASIHDPEKTTIALIKLLREE